MSTPTNPEPVFDLARAQKIMSVAGVDLLVASRRANVGYLTDKFGVLYWHYPEVAHCLEMEDDGCQTPHYFAALGAGPAVAPFVVAHENRTYYFGSGWIKDVRPCCWHAGKRNPYDALADAIEERKLSGSRIALEFRHFPVLLMEGLRKRLPKVEFVDAEPLLWKMRSVKSAREVERQRQAYRIAENIYKEVLAMIRRSDGNLTVADARAAQMAMATRAGCPPLHFGYVFPQDGVQKKPWDKVNASSFKFERGDTILLDLGLVWQGYTTDFGRNAVWGKARADLRELYSRAKKCREEITALIRPGVRCCDVYQQAMAIRRELKLPTCPGVGHSLGIECHENPSLLPTDQTVIEENMTLVVELVDSIGNIAFLLEDAGLVTVDGWKSLTSMSPDLIEME